MPAITCKADDSHGSLCASGARNECGYQLCPAACGAKYAISGSANASASDRIPSAGPVQQDHYRFRLR